MKQIYFYSPGATGKVYDRYGDKHMFVNTVPAYMHSYLLQAKPELAASINWAKIQLIEKTAIQLAAEIDAYNIDILCASVYIWNQHHILEVLKKVKKLSNRKFLVVAGGPSVDPHRDTEFFKNNPDVDYAVFAQGELAFASIIENVVTGVPIDFFNTKNLARPDQQRNVKLSSYEFIKKKFGSPYLDSAVLLSNIVNDPEYQSYKFYLPYETSKGCPYKCSFCDWTSGLSHKVSHRVENDWEAELDLLGSLGLVNLHISDANFGQHKQDIEIARTMARLKKTKGYQFLVVDTNFSKLKKKESFEILDILLSEQIVATPKFAVQDTNEQVLKNVDRPDIPWPDHKKYIVDTLKKYPNTKCQIELIMGLPGQTRDTWEQTMLDIQGFEFRAYPWVMLPNSPAGNDSDYQIKMQLKTEQICLDGFNSQPSEVIVETYSYDFRDYMYMNLISKIMTTHLRQASQRQLIFDKIRNSQHLETTLTTLTQQFRQGQSVLPTVYGFLDQLFAEYNDWPESILQIRKDALKKAA